MGGFRSCGYPVCAVPDTIEPCHGNRVLVGEPARSWSSETIPDSPSTSARTSARIFATSSVRDLNRSVLNMSRRCVRAVAVLMYISLDNCLRSAPVATLSKTSDCRFVRPSRRMTEVIRGSVNLHLSGRCLAPGFFQGTHISWRIERVHERRAIQTDDFLAIATP